MKTEYLKILEVGYRAEPWEMLKNLYIKNSEYKTKKSAETTPK